jgi:sec-independent protein translocase protein TatA
VGLDNPLHIAFLLIVLLLVFGAKRLPEIGRSLGSGMREFKDSISGEMTQQRPPQQHPAAALSAATAQSPPAQSVEVEPQAAAAAPVAASQAPAEPQS